MMNKLVGILLICLLTLPSSAQLIKKDKKDSEFSEAISAFKQKRYEQAMSLFASLTKDNSNEDRNAYAHYYYANAAQHLNKDQEGWNMLQQLLTRHPNWSRKDEAYYLAGLLNFKLKGYYRGLDYLNRITTSSYQKDVQGLIQHYIGDLRDVGLLKGLNKQFPEDRIIASTLVKAILEKGSAPKSELDLAKSLTEKFKLAAKGSQQAAPAKKEAPAQEGKKYYDVAVLLPFRLDAFDASSRVRSNQYVYDYYQGLLLAQKQLRNEKIEVKLNAFDVSNEKNAVRQLSEIDDFRNSNLILGPLHPETSEEAAEFSRKTGIPVINPLSTDSKLLNNKYPFYYLAHASLELQARHVIQVANSIDPEIRALIFYGTSQKDSTLAALYVSEVRAKKGQILGLKKIESASESMAPVLSPEVLGSLNPSHIVLFSTDPRAGQNFLSLLKGITTFDQVPLIATATAFDRYNTDFSRYDRHLYLLDTDYIDLEKQEVKNFRYQYYMAYNTLPSIYSYLGYDHLLFLGRKLDKYKEKTGEGIAKTQFSDRVGYLLGGFDFGDSRENTIFTIRRYQHGNWVDLDGTIKN